MVLALLLSVAAAVAVLAVVAVPRVREGDRLLTADGEAAVRDARRRARALAADARERRAASREPRPEPRQEPSREPRQERRADAAVRIARKLEWGEPEPGPRHRR